MTNVLRMNKAERVELAQTRILSLLAEAGPRGLRRTAIAEALPHDWSFTTRILDEMTADGQVTLINRFYLSPHLEDEHRDLQRAVQRAREVRVLQRNKGVKVEIVVDGEPSGWAVKVPHWMVDRDVTLRPPGSTPASAPESEPEPEPESEPEPQNFWGTTAIPAGKPGLVLVPDPVSDDLAEIQVPAQPFAWTPQVYTTGPHNTQVMVLAHGYEPGDFWA